MRVYPPEINGLWLVRQPGHGFARDPRRHLVVAVELDVPDPVAGRAEARNAAAARAADREDRVVRAVGDEETRHAVLLSEGDEPRREGDHRVEHVAVGET